MLACHYPAAEGHMQKLVMRLHLMKDQTNGSEMAESLLYR